MQRNCLSFLSLNARSPLCPLQVALLLVIVCYGVVALASPRSNFPSDVSEVFAGTSTSASAISLAFYQGLYSFAGFNYLNFLMGKKMEPHH